MDKILCINGKFLSIFVNYVFTFRCPAETDGDLSCQSGARWEQINDTLRDKDIPLFFPVSAHAVYGSADLTLGSLILDQALYVL
jgi:hypothetical protein